MWLQTNHKKERETIDNQSWKREGKYNNGRGDGQWWWNGQIQKEHESVHCVDGEWQINVEGGDTWTCL